MTGLPQIWGATAAELALRYGCDDLVPRPAEVWFRAVTVRAPRSHVFRWLCQLKVAPYSYDVIDNWGRRSPRTLTPGADALRRGETVMTIFELADFEADEHLTLRLTDPTALVLFGPFAVTYALHEEAPEQCRLVAKLNVGEPGGGALEAVRRRVLAWGDLAMMRRQLATLRDLAEAAPVPG